ncbi:MAG TPA: preprotein translocase subunit YajC [Chitinophagaceae bacterium]|nr:preprotein translocase subunit YajC [Chitinophagaceae bacterium]
MTLLNAVLLMAPPSGQQGGGGSSFMTPLFIGGIFLIMWLFMIRPQAKKAKEQKKYIEGLQKGDKVVTHAGIHGTIYKVNEDTTVQLETSPGSYLKVEKSAISLEMTQAVNKAATATTDKK